LENLGIVLVEDEDECTTSDFTQMENIRLVTIVCLKWDNIVEGFSRHAHSQVIHGDTEFMQMIGW
jgi:hypothetical protein